MEWTASEFCDQSALGSEAAVCVPVAFDLLGRSVPGPDEIEAAGIEMAPAQSGTIAHRIIVPSTIVPHADYIRSFKIKRSV